MPQSPQKAKRGLSRKDQRLAWVGDIGEPARPIWDWEGLVTALGDDGATVDRLVELGAVEFLLLHYQRYGQAGALGLAVQRGRPATAPTVRACESADTSLGFSCASGVTMPR